MLARQEQQGKVQLGATLYLAQLPHRVEALEHLMLLVVQVVRAVVLGTDKQVELV